MRSERRECGAKIERRRRGARSEATKRFTRRKPNPIVHSNGTNTSSLMTRYALRSVTSTLDKNPVFTATFFGSTLQSYMCTSLTQEWFQEGDHILVQGSPGSSVYFVKSGSVEVTHSGAPLGVLPPGSYFGEAPLLFPSALQPLSFVSTTPSSAFEWKISAFFKCLEHFPDLREVMELVLEQKMKRLGMESWKDRARMGKKDVQKERIRQLTTLFEGRQG